MNHGPNNYTRYCRMWCKICSTAVLKCAFSIVVPSSSKLKVSSCWARTAPFSAKKNHISWSQNYIEIPCTLLFSWDDATALHCTHICQGLHSNGSKLQSYFWRFIQLRNKWASAQPGRSNFPLGKLRTESPLKGCAVFCNCKKAGATLSNIKKHLRWNVPFYNMSKVSHLWAEQLLKIFFKGGLMNHEDISDRVATLHMYTKEVGYECCMFSSL